MKHRVVSLIAMVVLFCMATHTFADETIRLASGEWAPYQSIHLKYHGLASRIVTEAFALEGIRVQYGYFPWARSYDYAKTGEWDGTFLWFDTPERRQYFHVSDPVLDIQYVFFHLKRNAFDWESIDDLKGIRIGGTFEYDYGEAFRQAEKAGVLTIERVASDEQNLKKLLKGRIQIFPSELESAYALLRKHFTPAQVDLFTHHSKPVRAAPHHLLLPKQSKRSLHLLDRFNKGLKRLKESGLIEQYIVESRRGDYNTGPVSSHK